MPIVEVRRKFLCLITNNELNNEMTTTLLHGLINAVAYKRYGQSWAGDLLTKF